MKLLTFSTLYPNAVQPNHGIFVETRLRHLLTSGEVESRVLAPVPWFPFPQTGFGRYGEYARIPAAEQRFGIEVRHPRYLSIPKLGMNWAPTFLAMAARSTCRRWREGGYDFDAIDAHYFYPDGVAAVMLGEQFNRPVVVTARGSDINLIADFPRPRALILQAARKAAALVTVSRALKDKLIQLGVNGEKIRVLRNGVDLTRFRPSNRATARTSLSLGSEPVLASVGNLALEKGHDLVIRALVALPAARLLVVGRGAEEGNLRALATNLGVADRVRFMGLLAQEQLIQVYGAVDLLVLGSSREGWANVLLESMACGTPVVATDVGAASDAVAAPEAGLVVPERTAQALAAAIARLLDHLPDRAATRRYAEQFSWEETTRGQIEVFNAVTRCEQRNTRHYAQASCF
jgi:teichuronic acid biosynthesis glycosyltransferase TuaC